jgi:23S rRNA (adenine2030-N6)-methyltransferase
VNYRHHYHAGNFADVIKHVLLVQLLRALQKKETGFLYLDTHAGMGRYDLAKEARGATLERKPEWPDGIGRLWGRSDLPAELADYLSLVRDFDPPPRGPTHGTEIKPSAPATTKAPAASSAQGPRYYPGSPSLARLIARPQDRLVLCEKHPEEFGELREEFQYSPGTSVYELDGYTALKAMLPPLEKRALVLIDPPFEAQNEWAQIVAGLAGGLRRFPSGVFAIWYPLTERARVEDFLEELRTLKLPPTYVAEVAIAGERSAIKMRGCGLVVLNPPWQFDRMADGVATYLAEALAQAPGGGASTRWLVPEY